MKNSPADTEDRHSRFELRTLLETSRMLIESHDVDFVLNNLLLITMGKLMVSRGMILLHEPGSNRYVVSKSKGRNCPDEEERFRLQWDGAETTQTVFRPTDGGINLPEFTGDDHKNCIFFNLHTSNHHLGFLCLGPKGTGDPLSEREIEFVESLTIISSVAIANSRMFMELRRINRMLDRKVYELNTLFDLSKEFNLLVDPDDIIRIFKFTLLGQMLIRTFFFVLEHDEKRTMVASSGIKQAPTPKTIDRLFNFEQDLVEGQSDDSDIPFLAQNNIKAVIGLRFQNEKIALVGIGPKANKEEYTSSDFHFLRSLGNLALLSIQKTYLLEERIEKERLEEELNIAKTIQQGLLPDPLPEVDHTDLAATNISSYQVGGDYYDLLITPGGKLLVAIGDVTGKGIPAALLMANLQAMLHVLLPVDITLAEASGRLNDIIYENTPTDKFITFFWGLFNPSDYSFEYVNAGHNAPLLFRKGDESPIGLSEGGLILGAMPTATPYKNQTVSLKPGDTLVFYTDGVTEAMNAEETEEFGEERLFQTLKNHLDLPASKIVDGVVNKVDEFSGGVSSDDITLVVLKIQ